MTDRDVFVVQEAPTGRWRAECCNTDCEGAIYAGGVHTLAYTTAKAPATAAATRHRRHLGTIPTHSDKPRRGECAHCGQSEHAIAVLQQLVSELESRLVRTATIRTIEETT